MQGTCSICTQNIERNFDRHIERCKKIHDKCIVEIDKRDKKIKKIYEKVKTLEDQLKDYGKLQKEHENLKGKYEEATKVPTTSIAGNKNNVNNKVNINIQYKLAQIPHNTIA